MNNLDLYIHTGTSVSLLFNDCIAFSHGPGVSDIHLMQTFVSLFYIVYIKLGTTSDLKLFIDILVSQFAPMASSTVR